MGKCSIWARWISFKSAYNMMNAYGVHYVCLLVPLNVLEAISVASVWIWVRLGGSWCHECFYMLLAAFEYGFKPFQTFWERLRTFDNFGEHLRTFEDIWIHLIHLNTFEYFWILLNTFEYFWILLNTFEYFWILLNTFFTSSFCKSSN